MTWRDKYFLPEEVSGHRTADDCWIVIFGVVKNVTALIEEFRDTGLANPILIEAGRDVSYWFETDGTKPILKTRLDPETGARVSVLPFKIPHEPRPEPDVGWSPIAGAPWWQDERYNVGVETVKPVRVRVMNPLIRRSATIKVCSEDTVRRIIERYLPYNPEIGSYTVKYLGKPLTKDLNLLRNGVTLKQEDSVENFVPTLMLYFQDIQTVCNGPDSFDL